jgi:hypothetical protein
MATQLTKTTIEGPFGDYGADEADVTMAAADPTNGNMFRASGKDVVLAHNSGAAAHTVTITSAADPYGRTRDISAYSLGAGEIAVFGPFGTTGWMAPDGYIYLSADSAEVRFGVVGL